MSIHVLAALAMIWTTTEEPPELGRLSQTAGAVIQNLAIAEHCVIPIQEAKLFEVLPEHSNAEFVALFNNLHRKAVEHLKRNPFTPEQCAAWRSLFEDQDLVPGFREWHKKQAAIVWLLMYRGEIGDCSLRLDLDKVDVWKNDVPPLSEETKNGLIELKREEFAFLESTGSVCATLEAEGRRHGILEQD